MSEHQDDLPLDQRTIDAVVETYDVLHEFMYHMDVHSDAYGLEPIVHPRPFTVQQDGMRLILTAHTIDGKPAPMVALFSYQSEPRIVIESEVLGRYECHSDPVLAMQEVMTRLHEQ